MIRAGGGLLGKDTMTLEESFEVSKMNMVADPCKHFSNSSIHPSIHHILSVSLSLDLDLIYSKLNFYNYLFLSHHRYPFISYNVI